MAEPGTREVWFEGAYLRTTVSTEESGGSVSVMEHWMPAGFSPPTHVHHREDQVLHVLEGEITARLGDLDAPTTVVHPGESIFLPRGVPHCFVTGEDGARMLEINTPGGFEKFHVEAGVEATEVRIPDPTEPNVPLLTEKIGPYEAEFVGPPMS